MPRKPRSITEAQKSSSSNDRRLRRIRRRSPTAAVGASSTHGAPADRNRIDEGWGGWRPHVARGAEPADGAGDEIELRLLVESRAGGCEVIRLEDVVCIQPHEVLGRRQSGAAIAGHRDPTAAGLRDPGAPQLQPRQHLSCVDIGGRHRRPRRSRRPDGSAARRSRARLPERPTKVMAGDHRRDAIQAVISLFARPPKPPPYASRSGP